MNKNPVLRKRISNLLASLEWSTQLLFPLFITILIAAISSAYLFFLVPGPVGIVGTAGMIMILFIVYVIYVIRQAESPVHNIDDVMATLGDLQAKVEDLARNQ